MRIVIIGNGLLAQAFSPRYQASDDVLVFASGVSNSLETSESAFARERNLLEQALRQHRGKLLYFGSCSVVDADRQATPYASHKSRMESLVLARPGSLVVRLPQVVGRTPNASTLTNFLYSKITKGEPFNVWTLAERNLVDADDVAAIGAMAVERMPPDESRRMAVAACRSVPMLELVAIFERILGRKANYTEERRGAPLRIDASEAHRIASELDIDLGEGYVERILRKYYGDLA